MVLASGLVKLYIIYIYNNTSYKINSNQKVFAANQISSPVMLLYVYSVVLSDWKHWPMALFLS